MGPFNRCPCLAPQQHPLAEQHDIDGASEATHLLEILENLGEEACLDVEQLASRISAATTDKGIAPVPVLYDVYPAYGDLCEAVANMSCAGEIYLVSCRLALDPTAEQPPTNLRNRELDPPTAWLDFIRRCGQVPSCIATARERWDEADRGLRVELRDSLNMSRGWEWIFRLGDVVSLECRTSRRIALLDDLDLITMDARWHLWQLGDLCSALQGAVERIEDARKGEGTNASRKALSHTAHAAALKIYKLEAMFTTYQSSMMCLPDIF
ncbi:hypothetical protein FB451DRAFT_1297065 [Mycena latifolia]|nr:hypothetical protein FB451DRAFT_1297065 [Mycena latifolia]